MAKVKDIYRCIDEFAPFSTQMSFDNAGLLVGGEEEEVTKLLLTLDITLPVIEEAAAWGAQLIVSHHPVIFDPVKRIVAGDPTGEKLAALLRHGLSAICAHTNLDVALGGVNDALAQVLGLKDCTVLEPMGTDREGRVYGLGRAGMADKEYSFTDFAGHVKERLGSNGVRFVDPCRPVRRVAVGGGSCGSCLGEAWKQGCDVLVTADVKYDVFLEAKALGMGLIDAGHFPTENVVLPVLEERLNTAFPAVECRRSTVHHEVFSYL